MTRHVVLFVNEVLQTNSKLEFYGKTNCSLAVQVVRFFSMFNSSGSLSVVLMWIQIVMLVHVVCVGSHIEFASSNELVNSSEVSSCL